MRIASFIVLLVGLALVCAGAVPREQNMLLALIGIVGIVSSPLLFVVGGRRAKERKEAQRHAEVIEAIKSKP